MKKSMIAAAVVATAFAATANAGWFQIRDASYNSGGSSTVLGDFQMNAGSLSGVLSSAGVTNVTTGSASNIYNLNQTAVDDIVAAVGGGFSPAGNARLTYFGMEASASGPGYFGFLFQNNTTARDLSVVMASANLAAGGVYTNFDTQSFGFSGGGTTFQTLFGGPSPQLAANGVYVAIFAGMPVGTELGAGTTSDNNFDLRYLEFDGSNWATIQSGSNVNSSSLNYATYAIPVPAPALLAGAGLVGAAALRRRMAKKA